MSMITTHVLDTSLGRPAAGVPVRLEIQSGDQTWKTVGQGTTDADGRASQLLSASTNPSAGTYRLTFDTGAYFKAQGKKSFYPEVSVVFSVHDPAQHYHVPLLLSPYGYSTYRGS
jgi:5-hydroxyisourate hydrolase